MSEYLSVLCLPALEFLRNEKLVQMEQQNEKSLCISEFSFEAGKVALDMYRMLNPKQ